MSDVRNSVRTTPFAFSTLAFPGEPLESVVSLGRDVGYDGIELRLIDGKLIPPDMTASERERVKRILGELPVVAVDTSVEVCVPERRDDLLAYLRLAHDWSAPLVRVFGGPLPADEPERRSTLDEAAAFLEAAVPEADRLGVEIGVETHDAFASSATVAALLALVPERSVGAVWDSHHPHRVGETPAEVYANLNERVLLAQVKDARRSETEASGWELVALGEGEVDVRAMLAELLAHGYRGWVSVEWERHWHPEIAAASVALPQHLQMLRHWVAELSAGEER